MVLVGRNVTRGVAAQSGSSAAPPAGLAAVAAIGFLAVGAALLVGCGDPEVGAKGYVDSFDRRELGPAYRDTIGRYVVYGGRLHVAKAYNHPLWLKRKLPANVVIEFDAWSFTPDGDIKVELFGDGRSFTDHRGAYRATGYVICLGGWNNSKSFIARQLEHPPADRARELMASRKDFKVKIGQRYHFRILRRGGEIRWELDGREFLSYMDPRPLRGRGHDHFAFSNWASEVAFDNLTIRPLGRTRK